MASPPIQPPSRAAQALALVSCACAAAASLATLLWSGSFPSAPGDGAYNAALAEARGWSLVTLAIALVSPPAGATTPPADGPTATARDRVAADELMSSYEPNKAWFPSSWWNSAVALQTIGDYMQRTGDRRFLGQLDNTFEKDKGVFPAGKVAFWTKADSLVYFADARLRCEPRPTDWDYVCSYTPTDQTPFLRLHFGVNVDSKRVLQISPTVPLGVPIPLGL